MVGYLGRSPPGIHPPRHPWFFTPPGGAGTILLLPGSGGRAALSCGEGLSPGATLLGKRWHWASLPRGAAAPSWLIHPAPRGRCGETGVAGSRGAGGCQDFGDTHSVTLGAWQAGSTAFSGHSLQTGGALTPGGTGSTSIALGRRDRKWVLAKPCVPSTALSPSQQRPCHRNIPPAPAKGVKPNPPPPFTSTPQEPLSGTVPITWVSPGQLSPDTHLSTIVTRSTISTTRTLGTGGALDAAFTGEASLTLEGGRERWWPSGGWGLRGRQSQPGIERGSTYPGTGGTGGTSVSRDTLQEVGAESARGGQRGSPGREGVPVASGCAGVTTTAPSLAGRWATGKVTVPHCGRAPPALTCSPGLPASPGGPAGPGRPWEEEEER